MTHLDYGIAGFIIGFIAVLLWRTRTKPERFNRLLWPGVKSMLGEELIRRGHEDFAVDVDRSKPGITATVTFSIAEHRNRLVMGALIRPGEWPSNEEIRTRINRCLDVDNG